jgi:hypothetical protein
VSTRQQVVAYLGRIHDRVLSVGKHARSVPMDVDSAVNVCVDRASAREARREPDSVAVWRSGRTRDWAAPRGTAHSWAGLQYVDERADVS